MINPPSNKKLIKKENKTNTVNSSFSEPNITSDENVESITSDNIPDIDETVNDDIELDLTVKIREKKKRLKY